MRRTTLPFLSVIFFCLLQQSVQAQILYKVNFHDKNFGAYEGLLVYFNESRSYMRIAYYTADKKYHVVNVDYKSSNGTYYDGSSYFYMSGSNPKFITANPDKYTYNPDYFIWRKRQATAGDCLPKVCRLPAKTIPQFNRKTLCYSTPSIALKR